MSDSFGFYQSVVAGPGSPAYAFTASHADKSADVVLYRFVANGISNAPTFSGITSQNSQNWNNAAGATNDVGIAWDDWELYYSIIDRSSLFGLIPTPIAFSAALNGTTLTITYGGAVLGSSTPPLSAFAMSAMRTTGLNTNPAPYQLSTIDAVASSASTVTLHIAGGTFQSNDSVQLSYIPQGVPLKDVSGFNKLPQFQNAVVTVQ